MLPGFFGAGIGGTSQQLRSLNVLHVLLFLLRHVLRGEFPIDVLQTISCSSQMLDTIAIYSYHIVIEAFVGFDAPTHTHRQKVYAPKRKW